MKNLFKIVGIVIAAIFGLAIIGAIVSPDSDSGKATEAVLEKPLTQAQKDSAERAVLISEIEERKKVTSTPDGIVEYFKTNEVKADQELKGQKLTVEGEIASIGLDIMDNPYITLESSDGIRSVQCLFEDKSVVSNLSKGQTVTVRGECKGLMMNVLLEDCEILENISSLRAKVKALKK